MRYQPLFRLQVRHGGYPDGRCDHLQIVPRTDHPSGERALARHRLLVRTHPHVTEVMTRVDGQGAALAFDQLTLGFELRATGSDFAGNTDLSAWAGVAGLPRYIGEAGRPGPELSREGRETRLQLDAAQRVAEPQRHSPATSRAATVLARIDIVDASTAWLSAPPTFTLEFAPRQSLWVYYLLTQRTHGDDPHIEDGDRKHPLAFVRKRLTAANTPASADPIGARLMQRNPGHRCHRLVSKRPVAWRQAARRQLSLYLGDELLIRELATPSLHNSAILAKPQRETIYRVVVY
jgi:hypothetical protein